jgi:hypothetical protein
VFPVRSVSYEIVISENKVISFPRCFLFLGRYETWHVYHAWLIVATSETRVISHWVILELTKRTHKFLLDSFSPATLATTNLADRRVNTNRRGVNQAATQYCWTPSHVCSTASILFSLNATVKGRRWLEVLSAGMINTV